ncbi:glutamate 5-kinase [Breznakibacter xylanolyticus]|uniref:Glutamate 5-kinase n=1 Tax=Breznakibacter xylanolyticus TaxID=990 RepID=A0A2W7NGZ0_9BACT|nr:glutamate 5-kinase [Breznakibacter xylanolyticus]PZX17467.1 glutamate 5-kinase [Breznakibacter xylanolyticus]
MFQTITIKIGSNVLAAGGGMLNEQRIAHLVDQIAQLHREGKKVILVSSGAVASGRSMVKLPPKTDTVAARQVLSSVGQVKLLNLYTALFEKHGMTIAQVLVTKEDFRTREHYLNMKNCLTALLDNHILPIINENDAVSVTALMFTDNDELSGLIASMMDCDALFILTNVDGIYDGDPKSGNAKVIERIENPEHDMSQYISTTKSDFGRGGMLTKCRIAQKTASSGISVHIANGSRDRILETLANQPQSVLHTHFLPGEKRDAIKKWIAYSDGFTKAEVTINEGAVDALHSHKASSLLLAGVTAIHGEFKKGDLLRILAPDGEVVGIGRAQFDADKAHKHLGDKKYKPIIHYDYLYLYPKN